MMIRKKYISYKTMTDNQNTPENLDINEIKKKSMKDMSPEELNAIAQKAVDDAKERMHQNDVAYVEVVDGERYLRNPDGSLTPINR